MKPLPQTPGLNIVFVREGSAKKPLQESKEWKAESSGKPDIDYVEPEPGWYAALYQEDFTAGQEDE
jgi:hypothetical protein